MKVNDPNEAERFHVGATIAGRYNVERPIAEGAMGTVALARHVSLDERVAIKFLRPELRRDAVAIARLSREAKALARIKSDHVCRVLDVGVTLSVGPYMVMEYLEGTDLGELIDSEGPLPPERAVECLLQVCEALTVAHTAGITHRDLKPQNLFLARHGQFETLKVLDFGIAEDDAQGSIESSAGAPAGSPTAGSPTAGGPTAGGPASGHRSVPLYGTPSYMSPERVKNDPSADHRSDIWSIGVVLHELVTGRAVFDGPTLTETCARVISDAPLELEMDERVLPASLREIITRCLQRDPARRYQSVEELAAALAPLGTMQERFRGRSTGAFSRKMVEEALARHTQRVPVGLAGAAPESALDVSAAVRSGLREIGAGFRALARAVPVARVYERPLWLYAVVAFASALSVVAVATIGGDVNWMSPRPVVPQAEPVNAAPRPRREADVPVPPVSQASRDVSGTAPLIGALVEKTAGVIDVAEPVVASERVSPEPRRSRVASSGSRARASSTTPERRATRRHERPASADAALAAEAAERRMRLVTERASRVRLVGDNRGERATPVASEAPGNPAPGSQAPGKEATGHEAPTASRSARAQGTANESPELPDWLQAIKPELGSASKSDGN